jgi:hypothetical protein
MQFFCGSAAIRFVLYSERGNWPMSSCDQLLELRVDKAAHSALFYDVETRVERLIRSEFNAHLSVFHKRNGKSTKPISPRS